jgi:hypothetical protein
VSIEHASTSHNLTKRNRSRSVLSLLVGERVRNTYPLYPLCQAISEDLNRPDIEIQAGSLIRLYEVMGALTEQLGGDIQKL